ncbi:hypothetical protein [Taklimakanibacter albus]|uniref:Uncharacterized protein n=1 Tax=Taklimakanibacter albus TaxID=2800327 RepID=A0ACC5R156_9HYPH|nr:hypothetical protein [Aestuariivirga sp. YIM B02566]MBK1866390.1 hypothetical protein [Aestuariivirga sp. YIM B02566]
MPPANRPSPRPVLDHSVPAKSPRPNPGFVPPKIKWRFSFRHWRQISYFGVDQCDKPWFVSLLERLSEVSNLYVDDALSGAYGRGLRCHHIDWAAKNIPISRAEINWVTDALSEDVEFLQFSVSRARGRVVGFFDEDQVFNVVLLDPMHNIQPSRKLNYQVRATYIGQSEITKLSVTFQNLIIKCPHLNSEQQNDLLDSLKALNLQYFDAAVHLSISEGHLKKAYDFARIGAIDDLGELLQLTIDGLSS